MDAEAAIRMAVFKGNAAAQAQYAREGCQDYGSCGNAMLQLRGGSKLAKAALAMGRAYKSGSQVFVSLESSQLGIMSQSANVWQAQKKAFRDALIEAGFEKSIVRFWCYVD